MYLIFAGDGGGVAPERRPAHHDFIASFRGNDPNSTDLPVDAVVQTRPEMRSHVSHTVQKRRQTLSHGASRSRRERTRNVVTFYRARFARGESFNPRPPS